MLTVKAEFLTSAASASQFIKTEKPVIAVCGKSNVGKSSLINMLAGVKKLAKVSKEPGRTRLVNYFDMGWFVLADLPGYGFARVSYAEKARWARLMEDFFGTEGTVSHALILVDIRREPTADDVAMVDLLTSRTIPFTIAATKGDKLSGAQRGAAVVKIAAALKCGRDDVIVTSSEKRMGREELFSLFGKVIELHNGERL